jgi:hypothetical protein
MCDANWGPQDQSVPPPNTNQKVDLFKSRSVSGFLIWLGGPLHWVSKRQTITARSSAESEIYATDECTKCLLHLAQIVAGYNLTTEIMAPPTMVYNDNAACVQWAQAMATKGLRHIQIRDNAVCESVQNKFIMIAHIAGKLNLSDMFTKEEKNAAHFITIRDHVLTDSLIFRSQLMSQNGPPIGSSLSSSHASEGGVGLGIAKRQLEPRHKHTNS